MAESNLPMLRVLRTERGLSQPDLADALGFSKRTVIRWENGDSEPVFSDLKKIAEFFNVTVNQLIGDNHLAEDRAVVRAADLSGSELDDWVAKLHGLPNTNLPFSTDWKYGGPIIDREMIDLQPVPALTRLNNVRLPRGGWLARCAEHSQTEFGETALIAAMRAYVSAKAGTVLLIG